MIDFDKDEQDGTLFRFWIRAASEFPGDTMRAIGRATTPAEYRKALIDLAVAKRINLPPPTLDARLLAAITIVGPKTSPELGVDMTDDYKVKAYNRLRDALYAGREKARG